MNVYIWEDVPVRTFTISWTEQSDMSSGWTYSDDAAGLTAGSSAFDEFFGYYGCRLNSAGTETAKVEQSSPGVLDITQLGTLTSGDNVMIAFPRLGIKMSKSGSVVTLSITDNPEADGFQYYAHTKGSTAKDTLYLGAYKMTSGYKSLSGQSPLVNQTRATFRSGVKSAYDSSAGTNRYSQITIYPRWFINALYMMKYGNPNSQSVVGQGYTNGSSYQSTGATNSITNATGATTTSSTGRIKLFGLEDRWGNVPEWVGGAYTNSSKVLYCMLTGRAGTLSGGESTGTTITQTSSYTCLSSVAGNNKAMFAPIGTVNNSSWNTYYSSYNGVNSSCLWSAGGSLYDATGSGIFEWIITNSDITGNVSGSRLMYLNGLT